MARSPRHFSWNWRNPALRGRFLQLLAIIIVVSTGIYLTHNTLYNLRARGIKSGFEFITQPAGFSIGEGIIDFDPSESYGKAYLVGLTNTLRVAIVGLLLTTGIGTLVGVGRLSGNLLIRALSTVYVETVRSVPVLLQLFMWYFVLTELLPSTDDALKPLSGLYLSKGGLQFSVPSAMQWHFIEAGFALALLAAWGWARFARNRRERTGVALPEIFPGFIIVIAGCAVAWGMGGATAAMDVPEKTAISIVGGGAVTPEYLTILLGLSVYFASYVAEIVRAGIQSVPPGQIEAASSLGLTRLQTLRKVLAPQAMRVIIPPLTSQYVNLIKNSSLAVAVGYPDLVSISSTSLNQTGRAIECISMMAACFLSLSLGTSALMNIYNLRNRLKDRNDD